MSIFQKIISKLHNIKILLAIVNYIQYLANFAILFTQIKYIQRELKN